jgi:sulfide:quinone oxidoreductase
MARVVIVGASTGGLPAAYEIKAILGKGHEVTVVSNSDIFHFVPSNPWVAVGWRTREDISFPLKDYLAKKGINFTAEGAASIDPVKKEVVTSRGTVIPYDYLVIATGPKLAFEDVEGLGPEKNTASVCTVDHAERKRPGPGHSGRGAGRVVLRPRLRVRLHP